MAKLGKKYLDKNGLSYLWKKIDGRYVHINGNETFDKDEIIVGIAGENGVTGSGVTIGGATLSTGAPVNVVATEKAVAAEVDKINSAIEALGSVMSFLGVTTTNVEPTKDKDGNITYNTNPKITLNDGTVVTASNGDVVIYSTKKDEPEEFIWTQTGETGMWQEIGKVFNDEAITEVLGSDAIDVTKTNGTSTVSLKLDEPEAHSTEWTALSEADKTAGYGHIHLTQTTNGLKAEYGREVLTDGDSMDGSDINEAIDNAPNIAWSTKENTWVSIPTDGSGVFDDYTA
jgi:hypothetical protein